MELTDTKKFNFRKFFFKTFVILKPNISVNKYEILQNVRRIKFVLLAWYRYDFFIIVNYS